jgi:hypothetical protein
MPSIYLLALWTGDEESVVQVVRYCKKIKENKLVAMGTVFFFQTRQKL